MVQFDESKVINTLHPEKAEVGKKYWYADSMSRLKCNVEHDYRDMSGKLKAIDTEYALFEVGLGYWYLLYPYEEPPKKRMTYRQLAEWIARGNGEYSSDDYDRVYVEYFYFKNEKNNEVDSNLKIRTWNSEEWVEPTADIYERDCKGVTNE